MKVMQVSLLLTSLLLAMSCSQTKENSSESSETLDGYELVFLDVQDTVINSSIDPNVLQETKLLSHLNLTTSDHFWGEKRNFHLRGFGTINIPEAGEYYFKLTSSGKTYLQLNNVTLISHYQMHSLASREGKRKLNAGLAVFDFGYFSGNNDPYFLLEWSKDGQTFEPIPDELINGVNEVRVDPWTGPADDSNLPPNTLTEEEVADGWKLLFDGETTNGWHTYNNPGSIGSKWQIKDGTLMFEGYGSYFNQYISGVRYSYRQVNKKEEGGLDIVTDDAFENFEFSLEWKISKDGNSGIFYTVQEIPEYGDGWNSSPEMQILDNQGQKDGLIMSHRAADLYDLIPSNTIRTRAHSQWNKVKIVKNQGKVEHWMNGEKVLTYELNTPEWKTMIENSKFAQFIDNYGLIGPGKIGLQDHDDRIWFRNIKIKEL